MQCMMHQSRNVDMKDNKWGSQRINRIHQDTNIEIKKMYDIPCKKMYIGQQWLLYLNNMFLSREVHNKIGFNGSMAILGSKFLFYPTNIHSKQQNPKPLIEHLRNTC